MCKVDLRAVFTDIKHVFQLLKFLVAISCSYEVLGAGQAESLALFKLFKIIEAI